MGITRLIPEFKLALQQNGQSLRWFHKNHIEKPLKMSYNAFTLQLNGYAKVSDKVKKSMQAYLEG